MSGNRSQTGFPHLVFRKNLTKVWVGGSRKAPKDRPDCGFDNELCPDPNGESPGNVERTILVSQLYTQLDWFPLMFYWSTNAQMTSP